MYYTETPEGVIVNVRAQPRSSRPGLDGLMGEALKVKIKSAPVDGKANKDIHAPYIVCPTHTKEAWDKHQVTNPAQPTNPNTGNTGITTPVTPDG